MWFAGKYNEHFTVFGTPLFFKILIPCLFGQLVKKEDSNQFAFVNGKNYLRRFLKICKFKTS